MDTLKKFIYSVLCFTQMSCASTQADNAFVQTVSGAVDLACRTRTAQSILVSDLESVTVLGNGKLIRDGIEIRRGGQIYIGMSKQGSRSEDRSATGPISCDVRVTPLFAPRDRQISIQPI